MIGYWKDNRRPMFTTGDNFLKNYRFLVPQPFFLLILLLPIFCLDTLINPRSEFIYDGPRMDDDYLKISYQQDGDVITGNIYWTYRDLDDATEYQTSYTLDSKFTGRKVNNQLIITLQKPSIEKPSTIYRELSKEQTLELTGDNIRFMNITAIGGRTI